VAEGLGFERKSERNPERIRSVCRVRPGVCGRDDRRAPPVSGLKSEGAYRFGREGKMGRGPEPSLGRSAAPRPFHLFSFFFSFLFFFCYFC
jgi:hypothetical protein